MNKARSYSRYTMNAVILLGKLIRLGRKQRRWSEKELAQRVGISRSTLQKIEKGDASCIIGLAFEAASIVGVEFFPSDKIDLMYQLDRVNDKIALLPKSVHNPNEKIDNDF